MPTSKQAALPPYGFLLPEEGHRQLQQLRNQALLLARFVFASTLDEEHMPLEIRRSMLGELLEQFGERIDDVLDTMAWITLHRDDKTVRPSRP